MINNEIRQLSTDGVNILPVTHLAAVLDTGGNNLEKKLNEIDRILVELKNNLAMLLPINEQQVVYKVRKLEEQMQANKFQIVTQPPLSSSAPGVKWQVYIDNDYFYLCTSENTWRRIAFETEW